MRLNTRKDFASRFGKPIYSFTLYEKVKRVTIALKNKDYPILMVLFDIPDNHDYIEGILYKICHLLVVLQTGRLFYNYGNESQP